MMKRVLMAMMGSMLLSSVAMAAPKIPANTFLNVAYGSDPRQVMDVYLPEGRSTSSTKVLVLIHGGSWSGGDKRTFTAYVDSLKNYLPGYAFVNINYRLASFVANKFPAQADDVKSALEYLVSKSQEYQVSSNKIILLGASAGAHLAMLQAYKNVEPVKPLAVISFFGPVDMADLYNNPVHPQVPQLLEVFIGGTPTGNPKLYEDASPLFFASSKSCPTLIFQGGKDPLVNPKQSALLKKKLDEVHVPNELIVYPEQGHGWTGSKLADSFAKIAAFLAKHV